MTIITYIIKSTVVTVENNILIEFECSAQDIDGILISIVVKYDTTIDEVLDMINDATFYAITEAITAKEEENEREKEKNRCKPLKDDIDIHIGDEKTVKKPKKGK